MIPLDESLETRAEMFARNAHAGQYRRGPERIPYIRHPEAVACVQTTSVDKAIAWLHDVLEDTGTTEEDLVRAGFPDEVVRAVVHLTHKADESYLDYIRGIAANPTAIKVKLADISHNLSDAPSKRQRQKYQGALNILLA